MDSIKRPLAIAGFAFGAGAYSVSLFGGKTAIILGALSASALIVCVAERRFRKATAICAIIFFAFGLALLSFNLFFLKATETELLNGNKITDAVYVPTEKVGASKSVGKIILESGESVDVLVTGKAAELYNEYTLSGTLEEIKGQYKNYYLSKNASLTVAPDKMLLKGKSDIKPITQAANLINQKCSQKLYEYLPQKEATVVDALLLGNKASLSTTLLNDFRTSGAAHVAVVSGMHLSVITSIIYVILMFLTKRRKISCTAAIIGVLCFMLITGLTPSVTRSGIMNIIMLLGGLFARKSDSLNSLGGAVLALILFNPLSVLDIGLQLSVTSTLGIITLGGYLEYVCIKYLGIKQSSTPMKLVISPISISVSASIATAPIIITSFNYFGIYFIITNLLLTFAVPLLLMFSLVFIISAFIPFFGFIAYPSALLSGLAAKYICAVVSTISAFPFSRLEINLVHSGETMTILCLFVAAIGIIKRTKRSVLKATLCALLIFSLVLSGANALVSDNTTLSVLYTGEGVTAILEKNGECAVISCGGSANKSTLREKLDKYTGSCLLTVKGGTKECGGMFSLVQNTTVCESYYIQDLSTNKRAVNSIDSGSVCLYSKIARLRFWNSFDAYLIPLEKSTAVVIALEEEYILILPNPEYLNKLPEQYREPSLLISTKTVDNTLINADNTIIACNKKQNTKNEALGIYDDKTLSLYKNGEINISFKEKINFLQRGE